MAGSISSGEDDAPISDINIVPLVDIILVLLIVFMITMPTIVGSAPIKVDLPETMAAAIAGEALPLRFSLRREPSGDIHMYLEEQPIDEAKLKVLVDEIGITEATEVSLAADKGIAYGEVVRMMDLLGSIGLHKIALDTKHSGS